MLAVILIISSECIHESYHPAGALAKNADFVDVVVCFCVQVLLRLFEINLAAKSVW